jgi:hypothetical protein
MRPAANGVCCNPTLTLQRCSHVNGLAAAIGTGPNGLLLTGTLMQSLHRICGAGICGLQQTAAV